MGRGIRNGALMSQDDVARVLHARGLLPSDKRQQVQYLERVALRKMREADPELFQDWVDSQPRVALGRVVRIF
jgi:hypothetical protein